MVGSNRMFLSETYLVEDCVYYDSADTDKHSNWDTTNSTDTITHDSTNKYYIFTKTANDDSFIKLTDSIIHTNVKIEYDFRVTSATSINVQPRIGLLNPSTGAFIVGRHANYMNGKFIAGLGFKNNNWTEGTSVQISSLAQNTWYHIETSITGSEITIKLYDGSTLLGTASMSFSDYLAQSNKLLIDSAYSKNGVWNLKNIKVKPL